MVSQEAVINREAIKSIKQLYASGKIDRYVAKELAQPVLDRINLKQAEVAKRHGKKNYPKLDFINAMR